MKRNKQFELKMEGNLQEAKTVPSVSYVDRFFSPLPNDARFGTQQWKRIVPVNGSSRGMQTFCFVLPKMEAPNVYLVRKTIINFQCNYYHSYINDTTIFKHFFL